MSIDVSTKEGRAELRRHVENFGRFCNDGSWWSPQVLALLDLVDALGGNAEVQRLQEGAYTVYPPFVQVAPDGSMLLRVPEVSGVGAPRVIANLRDALNAYLLDAAKPDPRADG